MQENHASSKLQKLDFTHQVAPLYSQSCPAVLLLCSQIRKIFFLLGLLVCFLHIFSNNFNTLFCATIPPYITKSLLTWSKLIPNFELSKVKSKLISLSKTTKLILLDSLLQEVCISSVSDRSLALSSLRLSVCLSQSQTSFFRAKESPITT